jgi:hypothetical protein
MFYDLEAQLVHEILHVGHNDSVSRAAPYSQRSFLRGQGLVSMRWTVLLSQSYPHLLHLLLVS